MPSSKLVSKPLSNFSRAWNGAVEAVKKLLEGGSVPFVAVYCVDPNFDLPADFDVSKYRGLALCHVTSGAPHHDRLIVYWSSEGHFQSHGMRLERDLALANQESKGILLDLQIPEEKWWQHFSMKDWVISAAAVITALTLLKGTAGAILEPPGAQVAFADLTPIRVSSGNAVSTEVNITNDRSDAKTTLKQVRGTALSQDKQITFPLTSSQSNLPPLAAGEKKTIKLSFTSPSRRMYKGPPERYELTAQMTARSGWLRGEANVESSAPLLLEVWPALVGAAPATIVTGAGAPGTTDRAARVDVVLYPGTAIPGGIEVAIVVDSASDEIADMNAVGKFESLPPAVTASAATHEIICSTGALEKFLPYHLFFIVDSAKSLSASRWKEIVDGIKINLH